MSKTKCRPFAALETLESRVNLSAFIAAATPTFGGGVTTSSVHHDRVQTNMLNKLKKSGVLAGVGTNGLSGASSVLVGDANGDGVVNFSDYVTLNNHFGTTTTGGASVGDFNGDGKVDFADYTLLSNNFGAVVIAAPTGLSAKGTSSSTVHVSWTDASANESGFRIYRSTDNNSFTLVGTVGANGTAFDDAGLAAGTTYYYKTAAYNSGGEHQRLPSGRQPRRSPEARCHSAPKT